MAGTPSSTTAASKGEVVHSRTATTTYAMTAPTPGPVMVSTIATCPMSVVPALTTSPEANFRAKVAPRRAMCRLSTSTVRKEASARMKVMVRWRRIPSVALSAPEAAIASTQAARAAKSLCRRPSSMAREIRYGGRISPTVQDVPSNAPSATRPG